MINGILFDFRDTLLDISEARKASSLFLYEFAKKKLANQKASPNTQPLSYEHFTSAMEETVTGIREKYGTNTTIHNWNLLIVSGVLGKLKVNFEGRELQQLLEQYDKLFVEKVALYPDAVTMLKFLHQSGKKMGVVIDGTSKRERAILTRLDLTKYFSTIIISEEVGKNKLSDVPLTKALEGIKLPASEVAVVGDRIDKDIVPANKHGCISFKLERKAGRYTAQTHASDEEKPRYTINTLTELANYL